MGNEATSEEQKNQAIRNKDFLEVEQIKKVISSLSDLNRTFFNEGKKAEAEKKNKNSAGNIFESVSQEKKPEAQEDQKENRKKQSFMEMSQVDNQASATVKDYSKKAKKFRPSQK